MELVKGKEQEYADWREKNADPYGRRCFTYAEEWADLMEARLAAGEPIEKTAKETANAADTDGITGFMYGMAVSILSKAWVHGEVLRRWHNLDTQFHHEGEKANETGAVLNPALLKIGG